MYNKYNIVSKIGTILSFFLLGFNIIDDVLKNINIYKINLKFLSYTILFFSCFGILWTLRYCFKVFLSEAIIISFINDNKKNIIRYKIWNNSEHNVIIYAVLIKYNNKTYSLNKKSNIFIPYNTICLENHIDIIDESENFLPSSTNYINVIYKYADSDSINYSCNIGRNMIKSELKMFKKLSEQK